MKKYIFLSSLFFSFSSFSSDIVSFQEDYNKNHIFSQCGVLRIPDEKIYSIKADIDKITFQEMLDVRQTRKLLTISENEYIILQKNPKLRTNTNKDQEIVEANPCYVLGLGPYLLQKKDLQNLPKAADNVSWIPYNFDAIEYKEHIFITTRFTAYNNPHWNTRFSHPEPFNDLNNRYWHTEFDINTIAPIRTVNFILQEIKTFF